MENNKLLIRLHVYDEEIEVTINRDEEENYRNAAKLITERYNVYSQAYRGRRGEKIIAYMTLIDIALMYENVKNRTDSKPFKDMLSRLTDDIDEALGT